MWISLGSELKLVKKAPLHTHTLSLSLSLLHHSPTLGSDFLADLELKTLHCMVGGAVTKSPSRVSSVGNVERLHHYPNDSFISGASTDIRQIKIITEVCL